MAVRLVEGGLQSYDPSQSTKTVISKTFKTGSGGSSSQGFSSSKAAEAQALAAAAQKAAAKKAAEEAANNAAELKANQLADLQAKRTAAAEQYNQTANIQSQFSNNRTEQTYNPQTGMYVKSTYGIGAGGTAIMTPPTPEEAEKIKEAEYSGSLEGIKEYGKEKFEDIKESSIIKTSRKKIKSWIDKSNEGDIAEFTKGAQERASAREDSWLSPRGVKGGFDWAATQLFKVSEAGAKKVEETGFAKGSWLYKEAPIKKQTAIEIVSTGAMFAGFSPFMRTGTAQMQESAYTEVKGRFVKKSNIIEELNKPNVDINGKKITIKDLTYSDKAARIKDALSRATTPAQRNEIIKVAQDAYGKEFVKDFASQEFGYVPTVTTTPKPITTNILGYDAQPLPIMKNIASVETSVTTLQPSMVGETSWVSNGNIMDTNQSSILDVKSTSEIKQDTKQKTAFDVKSILSTKSATKQDSALKTKQATKQDSALKTISFTKQISKLRTAQTPSLDLMSKLGKNILRNEPSIRKIPIKETVVTSTSTSKITKKNGKYKVYVKQYGEWILIDETDSLTKATARLKVTLAGTLRASGFVEKGGKKIKLDLGGMFRTAKKNKKVIVQKRTFRLGTFGEKKEIFAAKKSKKDNWLSGFTSNKKKGKKSKWL